MTRARRLIVLLLSFFGIADTTYLTQHALSGTPTVCSINGYDGCRIVAQSIYSHLFGIPLSVYGFLFYASLFILTAITIVWVSSFADKIIQAIAIIGVLASTIFMWIQATIIHAFCMYCIFSAVLTVLIVLVVFWYKKPAKLFSNIPNVK